MYEVNCSWTSNSVNEHSELLENHEEIIPQYFKHRYTHISVVPVAKGLTSRALDNGPPYSIILVLEIWNAPSKDRKLNICIY